MRVLQGVGGAMMGALWFVPVVLVPSPSADPMRLDCAAGLAGSYPRLSWLRS